ncbi:MAG: peptidoglycan editing factor PgeF [Acidobacteria bacterium]|nr:peptidoglycan editing factor PgeF [Acidobacteriota bacterium]
MTLPMPLPTPPPDFRWTEEPWGPMLRCRALDAVVQHGFTSRQLQLRPGERAGDAWASAAASVGCAVPRIGRVRQVHGAVVRVVRAGELDQPIPDADAAVTCDPGTAVAVVAADCVPILLADPVTGAVAAAHAGWRGTAAGLAGLTVATLTREWGVAPASLIAAIGPSIGACCYEVGEELLRAFEEAGHSSIDRAEWFSRDAAGRLRLDLWRANADQLVHAGLLPPNIHVASLCTQTHRDVFESFRAEGAQAGRMAAIVVAPPRR